MIEIDEIKSEDPMEDIMKSNPTDDLLTNFVMPNDIGSEKARKRVIQKKKKQLSEMETGELRAKQKEEDRKKVHSERLERLHQQRLENYEKLMQRKQAEMDRAAQIADEEQNKREKDLERVAKLQEDTLARLRKEKITRQEEINKKRKLDEDERLKRLPNPEIIDTATKRCKERLRGRSSSVPPAKLQPIPVTKLPNSASSTRTRGPAEESAIKKARERVALYRRTLIPPVPQSPKEDIPETNNEGDLELARRRSAARAAERQKVRDQKKEAERLEQEAQEKKRQERVARYRNPLAIREVLSNEQAIESKSRVSKVMAERKRLKKEERAKIETKLEKAALIKQRKLAKREEETLKQIESSRQGNDDEVQNVESPLSLELGGSAILTQKPSTAPQKKTILNNISNEVCQQEEAEDNFESRSISACGSRLRQPRATTIRTTDTSLHTTMTDDSSPGDVPSSAATVATPADFTTSQLRKPKMWHNLEMMRNESSRQELLQNEESCDENDNHHDQWNPMSPQKQQENNDDNENQWEELNGQLNIHQLDNWEKKDDIKSKEERITTKETTLPEDNDDGEDYGEDRDEILRSDPITTMVHSEGMEVGQNNLGATSPSGEQPDVHYSMHHSPSDEENNNELPESQSDDEDRNHNESMIQNEHHEMDPNEYTNERDESQQYYDHENGTQEEMRSYDNAEDDGALPDTHRESKPDFSDETQDAIQQSQEELPSQTGVNIEGWHTDADPLHQSPPLSERKVEASMEAPSLRPSENKNMLSHDAEKDVLSPTLKPAVQQSWQKVEARELQESHNIQQSSTFPVLEGPQCRLEDALAPKPPKSGSVGKSPNRYSFRSSQGSRPALKSNGFENVDADLVFEDEGFKTPLWINNSSLSFKESLDSRVSRNFRYNNKEDDEKLPALQETVGEPDDENQENQYPDPPHGNQEAPLSPQEYKYEGVIDEICSSTQSHISPRRKLLQQPLRESTVERQFSHWQTEQELEYDPQEIRSSFQAEDPNTLKESVDGDVQEGETSFEHEPCEPCELQYEEAAREESADQQGLEQNLSTHRSNQEYEHPEQEGEGAVGPHENTPLNEEEPSFTSQNDAAQEQEPHSEMPHDEDAQDHALPSQEQDHEESFCPESSRHHSRQMDGSRDHNQSYEEADPANDASMNPEMFNDEQNDAHSEDGENDHSSKNEHYHDSQTEQDQPTHRENHDDGESELDQPPHHDDHDDSGYAGNLDDLPPQDQLTASAMYDVNESYDGVPPQDIQGYSEEQDASFQQGYPEDGSYPEEHDTYDYQEEDTMNQSGVKEQDWDQQSQDEPLDQSMISEKEHQGHDAVNNSIAASTSLPGTTHFVPFDGINQSCTSELPIVENKLMLGSNESLVSITNPLVQKLAAHEPSGDEYSLGMAGFLPQESQESFPMTRSVNVSLGTNVEHSNMELRASRQISA